jgi:hypothetical protein
MRQSASADQPDVMWTTMPPAKSMPFQRAAALARPFMAPSTPQTMCTKGK